MIAAANEIRRELQELAEHLPDNVRWRDIKEYVLFHAAVEESCEKMRRGELSSEEEIANLFARYGVKRLKGRWQHLEVCGETVNAFPF